MIQNVFYCGRNSNVMSTLSNFYDSDEIDIWIHEARKACPKKLSKKWRKKSPANKNALKEVWKSKNGNFISNWQINWIFPLHFYQLNQHNSQILNRPHFLLFQTGQVKPKVCHSPNSIQRKNLATGHFHMAAL